MKIRSFNDGSPMKKAGIMVETNPRIFFSHFCLFLQSFCGRRRWCSDRSHHCDPFIVVHRAIAVNISVPVQSDHLTSTQGENSRPNFTFISNLNFAVLYMVGISLNIVLFTGPKIFENRREYPLPSGVTSNITLPSWNVTPKGSNINSKIVFDELPCLTSTLL